MAHPVDDVTREQVQSPINIGLLALAAVALVLVGGGLLLFGGLGSSARTTLSGHAAPVTSVAVSPDGSHIASSALDGSVRVWDLSTGRTSQSLRLEGAASSVTWSPDSKRIATGSVTVQVWDVATGQVALEIKDLLEPVTSLVWSPDGKALAGGVSNVVWVWDATSGEPDMIYTRPSSNVKSVAWSPDSTRVAAVVQDNTLRIIDAQNSAELMVEVLPEEARQPNSVTWAPDGRSVAVGANATIYMYDVADPANPEPAGTLTGHSATVPTVAWAPDGRRIASGSADGSVRIWVLASDQSTALSGPFWEQKPVSSLSWFPDSTAVASSYGNDVKVWDLK
jgi:WD40 repeat protein